MFQIELKDPAEAEAIISNNLTCPQTGLIFKVKSFVLQFRSSSVITAKTSDTRPKIVRLKLNLSSVENVIHTKDVQIKKKNQPKCPNCETNCKGPHVANYKGCPAYKKQVFLKHVVDNQKSYASILKQNWAKPPQPKGDSFSFSADQLIKFVATVAIQTAQPQVCYSKAPKDTVDKKSSLCRQVLEAAKSQLAISISGSTLFDAIGSVRVPVLPASKIQVVIPEPFRFSASTKLSAILDSLSPPPPSPLPLITRLSPNSLNLQNRTSPVGHLL